ncbi:NUDIX domain-containing protein [bacterium]|nr:NUDIX domain-containing protein [bacterium]
MTVCVTNFSPVVKEAIKDKEIDGAEFTKIMDAGFRHKEDVGVLRDLIDGMLDKSIALTPAAQGYAEEMLATKIHDNMTLLSDSSVGAYDCNTTHNYVAYAGCSIPIGRRHVLMSIETIDHIPFDQVEWDESYRGLPGGTTHHEELESPSCAAAREAFEETGLPVVARKFIQTYEGVFAMYACSFINPKDELLVAAVQTYIRHDQTEDNDCFIKLEVMDPDAIEKAVKDGDDVYERPEQLDGVRESFRN